MKEWLRKNWFGIFGLGLGLIVSTYFFLESRSYREPLFRKLGQTVLSVPTNVEGYPVRLINADTGEPIDGYVIEQRFLFQNLGNLAIRPENITLPLQIQLGPDDVRVLSARASDATRPNVIRPSAIPSANRHIDLAFSILEGGDAFAITAVVAATSTETESVFVGAVEGVTEIAPGPPLITGGMVGVGFLVLVAGWLAYILLNAFIKATDKKKAILEFVVSLGGIVLLFAIIAVVSLGGLAVRNYLNPASAAPPEMQEIPVEPSR